MSLNNVQAVILAAGTSSRLKTGKSKLIEKICGRAMIVYPTKLLHDLHIPTTLVVGFQKELIIDLITKEFPSNTPHFVEQKEQLGTGHAVSCSKDLWTKDHILIMNGDMPLVSHEIIEQLCAQHMKNNSTFSFVTAHNCEPTAAGYGRIVQNDSRIEIIEAKEFKEDPTENCCINAGIYLVKRAFLEEYMQHLQKSSVTGEWYITDLVKIASDNGLAVETLSAPFDLIRGVNTFKELWAVEQVKKAEIIKYWMDHGVRFSAAQNVHIDQDVTIKPGSYIDSGVQLLGKTHIGKNCTIGAFTIITDSSIGESSTIFSHTVISTSHVGNSVKVGPFAHVHDASTLENEAVIGNFVEVKRSTVGIASKAKHLSYLGDTTTGKNVNIGAGTITCNYNGSQKFATIIKDNAFIGSNNTLIAPLTIERDAFTAAGSTITDNVPENAFAIARTKQINKLDYAKKLKQKHSKNSSKNFSGSAIPTSESGNQTDDLNVFVGAKKSTIFETGA